MKKVLFLIACLMISYQPNTKTVIPPKQIVYSAETCGWSSGMYTPNIFLDEESLTEDRVCENEIDEDVFRFGFEEI